MISNEIDNLIADIENHENLDVDTHGSMMVLTETFALAVNTLEVSCINELNKIIKKLDT